MACGHELKAKSQRQIIMDITGFYKLNIDERLSLLKKHRNLSDEEALLLKNSGALSLDIANRMIENVIGAMHLPLAVATHFKINGKEMLVPMAIEEPSVVAGACKAAKLTLPEGFTAKSDEPIMIGQVQIVNIKDGKEALSSFEKHKKEIFEIARGYAKQMEQYGGGLRDISAKIIRSKRGDMLVAYFDVDVRDSMGANTVNTILEGVAPSIASYVGGKPCLRIISNLAVKRKSYAQAVWKRNVIGEDGVEGILDAYELAKNDIYRCVTHNKGIMNGIDAVALASGQDWRAIEAGAHAYASLDGYHPLTHYEKTKDGDLLGKIELPLAVGTVGGAINTSPTAKLALKVLGAQSWRDLAVAMTCVGLANNFAALYALSTTGIQAGHMKLHARNIAVLAGAKTPEEIDEVAQELANKKDFSLDLAKQVLKKIKE